MKVLLDVCVSSRSLTTFLAEAGHDVLTGLAVDPRASDEQLLELALREQRILVTEDKDFGELVFVHDLPHGSIVRLVELSIDGQVDAIRELLGSHSAELADNAIVTITRGRIRIRRHRK